MSLSYNNVTIFNVLTGTSSSEVISRSSFNVSTEPFDASNISGILKSSFPPRLGTLNTKGQEIYYNSMCVLSSVGIILNVLGAIVLSKLQKSNPGVRLLKLLAFVDITFLVSNSFYIVYHYSSNLPVSVYVILYGLLDFINFFRLICFSFETYLTVLIACQRAVIVAKPLQASRYLRRSIINIFIIVLLVFSILLNVPYWFVFERELYWNTDLNITWISYDVSEFYYSKEFFIHDKYVATTFRLVIPLVILIVSNTIIIIFSRRRTIQSTGGNHDLLVGMNIAVILMSVITHVAASIDRIVIYNITIKKIYEVTIVLNSSTNFVFYCMFGRAFRKTFKDVIQSIICTPQARNIVPLRN